MTMRDAVHAESHRQARSLWTLNWLISRAEACEGRSIKHEVSVSMDAAPVARRFKRALDPDGLFNPGKVYPRAHA